MNAENPPEKQYGYIVLSNGNRLDLLNPDPAMMDIETIAGPLSRLCRFSGQIREFYSVAQHSVLVSDMVPEEHRFTALMHDATEAFCADMPKPIKQLCPDYEAIEERMWKALCQRYDLPLVLPHCIHIADRRAVIMEARCFMDGDDWVTWYPGLDIPEAHLFSLNPEEAEEHFLDHFHHYKQRRAA